MIPASRLISLATVLAALSGAPAVAQDASIRSPSEQRVLKGIIFLPYEKHIATLQRLKIEPTEDFYNCLCKHAGYGSSGTAQFYHPGTLGEYDKRYTCNKPGDPCIVSGFGCMRYPLPTSQSIWDSCAATNPLGSGTSVLDEMLDTISARSGMEKRKLTEDLQRCLARHTEMSTAEALRDRIRGYDYLAASGVPVLPPPKKLAEAQKREAESFAIDAGDRLRQAEIEIKKALDQSAMQQLMTAMASDPENQDAFFGQLADLAKMASNAEAANMRQAESLLKAAEARVRKDPSKENAAMVVEARRAGDAARARKDNHDAMAARVEGLAKVVGAAHDIAAFSDALGAVKGGGAKEGITLFTSTMDMTQKYVAMATESKFEALDELTEKMMALDPTYHAPQGLGDKDHAQLLKLQNQTANSKFVVDTLQKGVQIATAVNEVYSQYELYESKVATARTRMANSRYSEAQQDLLFAMSVMSSLVEKGGAFLPDGMGDIATYFSEALKMPEMADAAMRKAVDTHDNFAQIRGTQAGSDAMKQWVKQDGHDLMRDDYLNRTAGLAAYIEDDARVNPYMFLSGTSFIPTDRLGYDKVAEMAYLFPIIHGRKMTDADLLDAYIKAKDLNKLDLKEMRVKAQEALSAAAAKGRIADLMGKKTITPEDERAYAAFSLETYTALPFGCAMDPGLERSLLAGWMQGKEKHAGIKAWLKAYGEDLKAIKKDN
ncbi:MAG: hypothetical protein WAT09_14500 [Paracoccaceae bacterium]